MPARADFALRLGLSYELADPVQHVNTFGWADIGRADTLTKHPLRSHRSQPPQPNPIAGRCCRGRPTRFCAGRECRRWRPLTRRLKYRDRRRNELQRRTPEPYHCDPGSGTIAALHSSMPNKHYHHQGQCNHTCSPNCNRTSHHRGLPSSTS